MNFIHPDFLEPHLSTKLYRTTFNYLKKFYSERIFEEICEEIGVPKNYLLSDDNWVSVEFGRKFAELVRKKTNDEDVYQKIGHFFFDAQNINPIEHRILKTFSPFGFFNALPRFYKRTNQACDIAVTVKSFGRYHIKITPLLETVYSDMVINTLGVLEGLKEFYNLKNFNIKLAADVKPGEEVSEFSLDLEFSGFRYFFDFVFKFVYLTVPGALVGFLLYNLEYSLGLQVLPVLCGIIMFLMFLLFSSRQDTSILKRNIELYYEKSREKNFQLYQKSELLDRRYREANLLKTMSTELITIKDPQKVLKVCLDSLESKFEFTKMALFLVSKKRKKLFLAESRGLSDLSKTIGEVEFDFPNPNAKEGFFATILEKGESVLVLDVENYKEILQEKNRRLLELTGANSIVVSPIQTHDEKYGLLVVFNDAKDSSLSSADKFLAEKLSNFLALYFDNAANFERESSLRQVFQQYVPPIVLEQLMKDGGDLQAPMAPERIEVISVFMDLRGFTNLSEKSSPEKVVQVISRYADFVSEIFAKHGAIIDNIVGDEIVMFFRCSEGGDRQIRQFFMALQELHLKWHYLHESMVSLGVEEFNVGMGAHIGPALVGNVGGNVKRNYTALGDTINTASRLQSLSKKFPSLLGAGHLSVLLSEQIAQKGNLKISHFESEQLRGKVESTKFAVCSIQLLESVDIYGTTSDSKVAS